MLEVICNGCGAKYKAPEKFAGRKMSCKACSEVMLIGEEAAPEVSSSPVEEEVSQAPAASEEKAPSRKKPSFKKGGISTRKGDKKSSFKKGGFSSSKSSEASGRGSEGQAVGGKKSPAMLVVILLLLVGGLVAVDFFVTNMVIGGKAPAGNEEVAAVDDSPEKEPEEEPGEEPAEESADEPEAPAEPEETEPEVAEPEVPAGSDEPEAPAEEAPALAAISPTSSPAALLVPADAQVIFGLNIPRLIAAYEGLTGEKLPRTPEELEEGSYPLPEPAKLAMAAGLDPFTSIRSILVAGEMPESSPIPGIEDFGAAGAAAAESDGLVLVEGQFSDPAAIVSVLVEMGVLSPSAPEVKAGLNVYSVAEGIKGSFTFLSTGQILFATDAWLDKVIARRKGEGRGILTNAVFNSMSKGLARKEALWLVADVPEEAGAALQQGLAVPPGGIPGPDDASEAPTPAIKIDVLMLALDSGGTDFSLELIGATPSPEDAENTKTTIGTQLGGISLLAMQMLGPKALGLMGKLTPKSDGNNVIISVKLNEKELAAVKEMAEKALAGFAGPPEGFDPSDFAEPPSEPGEAAVDPGDEGEEPEKEDDKEEDDPLELEDF